MGLTLERLLFDPTDASEGPNIGAYINTVAGVVTSVTEGSNQRLHVDADLSGIATPSEFGLYPEDSVHVTADLGQFILAVQTAAQGGLAADGDYAPLQVDSDGRLRTLTDIDLVGDLVGDDEPDTEDPLKMGGHAYDQAVALATVDIGDKANLAQDRYRRVFINDAPSIGLQSAAFVVDDTAGGTELAASAFAVRQHMLIQNNGDKSIFLGATGVTAASGVEVQKGDSATIKLGQAVNIFAIAASGTQDIRVMEWG